ncbi:3-methyladenine DNA glycosylase [Hypoxylon texense]
MLSKQILSAATALGMVSSVFAVGCDDPTATIRSAADATQIAECDTIEGSVLIAASATDTIINIGGRLSEIGGSLTAENNGLLQTLQSSSLETIGGDFTLKNVTKLSTLSFPKLGEVGSIDWATLNALPEPTFGNPGITKAKSVTIADTFIENIDGINVDSLSDMNINNNRRLTKFSTSIKSLTNTMYIQANGLNLSMEMPNLEWIANMTIANVTSFSVPSLHTVNGSMRFDSNYFTTFTAANLTDIQDGDLSFVSNPQLTNISIPTLTHIGGGFTIANNTALEQLDGFGALNEIGGAVKVRGSFTDVELPDLQDVKGAFEVVSTEDIGNSCNDLNKYDNGVVQGDFNCKGNDQNANNDTSDASSDGSSGTSNNDDQNSAASPLSASVSTFVTLASLGAFVAAFL